MITHYTLNGHEPVPCPDVLTWARWFEHAIEERIVRQDGDEGSGWWISTVFLGLDHNWRDSGPPLLFETCIFAPPGAPAALREFDGQQWRYSTWEEAERGHVAACHLLRTAMEQAR